MSTLSTALIAWLDGDTYAPGHPIVNDKWRRELGLGSLLETLANLGSTDSGEGLALLGFDDVNSYYAADNGAAALVALGVAIGGASSTVRNYSSNVYVADNDTIIVAIGKLDAGAGATATKAALLTRETTVAGAQLWLYEGTNNGVHKVIFEGPAALGADRTITIPDTNVNLLDGRTARDDLSLMRSGTATILNGNTSIVVAVGAECNGKPVTLTFRDQPTAAGVKWLSGVVAGGNLTITINVDNTADLAVYYSIDAR